MPYLLVRESYVDGYCTVDGLPINEFRYAYNKKSSKYMFHFYKKNLPITNTVKKINKNYVIVQGNCFYICIRLTTCVSSVTRN